MTTDPRHGWGAVPMSGGRWLFRLWALGLDQFHLRLHDRDRAMEAGPDGWFHLEAEARDSDACACVLPGGQSVPDPAARRQEGDVHGPSLRTAPRVATPWQCRPWQEAVIHELDRHLHPRGHLSRRRDPPRPRPPGQRQGAGGQGPPRAPARHPVTGQSSRS